MGVTSLNEFLVAIAGFVGGFVSTLASNGSSVTLPALDLLGLPEHVANGTNRLSVVALGLVGTISFARERLIDWRKGGWIAFLIAAGTIAGSFAATRLSYAILDAIVVSGLLLVLGMLLLKPSRWLEGEEGRLRPLDAAQALVLLTDCDLREGNAMKAFILLVVGLQSLLNFGETGEVNWPAGVPLALGSAVGAYAAARLVTRPWAKAWLYRFLVLVVVLSIVHLTMVDSTKFLQHA
jgi:uncharacterized protein